MTYAQNILGLDLGTHTGWAIRRRGGAILYGTAKFPNPKKAHPGQRWQAYRVWLSGLLDKYQIHVVAYEDVRRHLGTDAAHAYGAFEALLQMTAASYNVELLPVGVGVIKKAFTGNGRADKQDMLRQARLAGFSPDTDNAADALAVLHWAECTTAVQGGA